MSFIVPGCVLLLALLLSIVIDPPDTRKQYENGTTGDCSTSRHELKYHPVPTVSSRLPSLWLGRE